MSDVLVHKRNLNLQIVNIVFCSFFKPLLRLQFRVHGILIREQQRQKGGYLLGSGFSWGLCM